MAMPTHLLKVASALYCSLNTPRALSCFIMAKYRMWDQLVAMTVDPRNYLEGPWGANAFGRDAQATAFLRKSPLLPTSVNRRKAAVDTFDVCEKQCYQTNQMLQLLEYPSHRETPMETALRRILRDAQKVLSRILGPLPSNLEVGFGPGTSFELKGQTFNTLADKMWITPQVTSACSDIFEHFFWPSLWGRTRRDLCLPLPTQCRGNRFSTVPKDATKDRGICIEPLGNLSTQLGIGRYWKRRLGSVGLNVRSNHFAAKNSELWRTPVAHEDGQQIHRRLAREGSLKGNWGTIDLSNASDTVCFEIVRWVVPKDWFELLCAARSPATFLQREIGKRGRWVHLDKFSSMGNGYTFEVETGIFAAILAAGLGLTIGVDLFVYGDDIILPNGLIEQAMAILTACGFQPNMKKSFHEGPFRESCGGDFFSGYPVRPYYADGEFESPLEWIAMHNRLKELWPNASLSHKRCVDAIPTRLRVFGPQFLGDRVLTGVPLRSWEEDGCRWIATICAQPTRVPLDRWGNEFTLALACLGVQSSGITPRGEVAGFLIKRASIS